MWIASKYGFYSIVQKRRGEWHVRARVRKDLENLKQVARLTGEIETWCDADYRWRIVVKNATTIYAIFEELADSIDYTNFKSKIAATPNQRDKIAAYHEIWNEMYGQQQMAEARLRSRSIPYKTIPQL